LKEYKITLKHAHDLPVVDIGSVKKPNYLPAELCEIEEGTPYGGKLNEKETANMIQYACNPPKVNAVAIVNQGLPRLGLTSQPPTTPLSGFGITIDADMIDIPARELPPPSLTYKVGKPNVKDGSWNILDVKFQKGAIVNSWWVVVVKDGNFTLKFKGPEDPDLMAIVTGFKEKCKRSGMIIPDGNPPIILVGLPDSRADPSREKALQEIRKQLRINITNRKGKPTFALVLLSGRDNFIYPGMKRIGDVELGVHTVHMLIDKVLKDSRKMDQYFSNVALKVNTKLGGINHTLDEGSMKWLKKKRTMIVGMDVTHPSPHSIAGTPSIAAVVASVEDSFYQYPCSLRVQEGRKEVGFSLNVPPGDVLNSTSR